MRNENLPLSEEEFRQPRGQKELSGWIEEVFDRFKEGELKKAFRLRYGLTKIFVEEVLTFHVYFQRLTTQIPWKCIFPADSGNRDVILCREDDPKYQKKIEIVNAIDGKDNRFRMELLNDTGYTPGVGPIKKVRDRSSGFRIEADQEAISREEIVERDRALLEMALGRKAKNDYSGVSCLLIGLDDHIAPIKERIRTVDLARKIAEPLSFSEVYLIGLSDGGSLYKLKSTPPTLK